MRVEIDGRQRRHKVVRLLLLASALLLLATGCRMKDGGQFWDANNAFEQRYMLSGVVSSELRWQLEVTCSGEVTCMSEGLRNADWSTSGDGDKVVDLLVKAFTEPGAHDIARTLEEIPLDGSQCLIIGPNKLSHFTLPGHPDCEPGHSMQPG